MQFFCNFPFRCALQSCDLQMALASCSNYLPELSLVPRPFPPPVYDRILYAKTEGEGLGESRGQVDVRVDTRGVVTDRCNSQTLFLHAVCIVTATTSSLTTEDHKVQSTWDRYRLDCM